MGFYEDLPELDINDGLEDMMYFKNVTLVDVRTSDEYREGHIPGAINIPYEKISEANRDWVEHILRDKSARIYTYCYSGSRSGTASAFLRQLGYDRARNIGGFEGYTGPVEL